MSILSALERAKENVTKFKRAKCDIEWVTHKLSVEEKMLEDCKRLVAEYTESVGRLEKNVYDKRRWLDKLLIYVDEHEGVITDSNKAEELAKKIARLQEQVAKLTAEMLEKENAGTTAQTTE
jgi:polyhydroxyalkanoate synthesis regulator phasin